MECIETFVRTLFAIAIKWEKWKNLIAFFPSFFHAQTEEKHCALAMDSSSW